MAEFAACAADHASVLAEMEQHGQSLATIRPTPLSVATMTLEVVVSVRPDLALVASAVKRRYGDFSKLLGAAAGHWRGQGFSLPKRHRSVCVRGGTFGDSCLCLDVGTSEGDNDRPPWEEHVCHAKVFNSGHIKLMGCTDYDMASVATAKLVAIIQETSSRPVSVERSSTHLINGVFGMPPFARGGRVMDKEEVNNLARAAGFHVHSGASDGKPYVKLVLQRGSKALVYVSGKVWVTGCRSIADLGSAARSVQSFIDTHSEQLLSDG